MIHIIDRISKPFRHGLRGSNNTTSPSSIDTPPELIPPSRTSTAASADNSENKTSYVDLPAEVLCTVLGFLGPMQRDRVVRRPLSRHYAKQITNNVTLWQMMVQAEPYQCCQPRTGHGSNQLEKVGRSYSRLHRVLAATDFNVSLAINSGGNSSISKFRGVESVLALLGSNGMLDVPYMVQRALELLSIVRFCVVIPLPFVCLHVVLCCCRCRWLWTNTSGR